MTQTLHHVKKKIFGRSSEVTAPIEGKMFLFESTVVLQSRASEKIKPTLFHYSRTCSRKVAFELLTDYHGCLTTDAYIAYKNLNMDGIKYKEQFLLVACKKILC